MVTPMRFGRSMAAPYNETIFAQTDSPGILRARAPGFSLEPAAPAGQRPVNLRLRL